MADSGKILEKDIVEKKVYEIGDKISDSLKPASKQIDLLKNDWIKAMSEMKQSVFDLDKTAKNFKGVKQMKEFYALKEKQAKIIDVATKAQKDETKVIEQIAVAYKEQDRAEKNLISTIERKKLATESTVIALTKERYELQQLNIRAKQSAVLSSSLSTEYQKQAVRLTILQTKYKDLALTQGTSSKEAKNLKAQIDKLDSSLKKVDADVGQFQRSVGNYGKAMTTAASAARNMMSAMGVAGGAYLFVGVISDAFQRVRDFDKSMQNLSGVLRTSRKELAPLEADIIKVAGASIKTSREVANLAESLATLGKSPDQIRSLLKPVNDLSIGLNATSEEAGEFLVQMLNAFGASDEEAGKYADTIATIRTSTTLDFQKMRDSFQYIAPISKILNKDLAYTGSVVGILADNSLKAESAGRLLATAQQKLAKDGKSLTDALDEINKAQKENKTDLEVLALASKLFGSQAAKVGVILANNTDAIETNAQAIRDNGGALDDLVNEQLKSLDAKLKILDSSWEEFILTIENGEGTIASAYKGFIELLTNTIQKMTDLEKAQKRVLEATGVDGESGFKIFLKGLLPFVGYINSEYDDLIEKQTRFNEINENIDTNGLLTLELMYRNLNKEISKNKELSDNEIKLYNKQLEVIQNAIKAKKEQRKTLEAEAVALGFNEKELGKYSDKIKDYTDGDLQSFISKMKESTNSTNEETEATGKLSKEQIKANKALEDRLKLLADDKFNYQKAQLESQIEANKIILENDKETYDSKRKASVEYFALKEQLLKLERDNEVSQAQGRTDKLAEIQLKYTDDSRDLELARQKNAIDLLKDFYQQELKTIRDAEQAKQAAQSQEIGDAQNTLKSSGQTAADVEAYEKAVAEIKKRYALETVQAQIDAVTKLQSEEGFTTEQRAELAEQLKVLKIEYSNIETDQIIANLDKQKEAEEKLAGFKRDMYAKFSDGLGEALNVNAQSIEVFLNSMDALFDKTENKIGDVLATMSAAASVTRNVLASVYAANIEELQLQLDKTNEYYDLAYARAEGDKVQQDLLRKEQAEKEAILKKQIAAEKTKAAKADKAAAIVQAGINTALAVTSALTQAPPAGYVMAAISAALGLAQIAIIASKPIPKFKDGHLSGTHEGWALTNDGGRDEVWERDGEAQVIKGRNVPIKMEKGDKIHRSVEDWQKLRRASILASVDIDNQKLKRFQAENSFNSHKNAIDEKAIQNAISDGFKKQKVNFHTTTNTKVDIGHDLWKLKQLYRN